MESGIGSMASNEGIRYGKSRWTMKVANRFSVGAWGRFRRRNDWMMMDMLLAMTFVVLAVTAFLPLMSQTVSFDRRAHIQEALLRQAVSIEATLFQELVYGQEWDVSFDSIRFTTPQGRRKGFLVHGDVLFVRLNDGTYQPLTGGVGTVKGCRILIYPYDKRPFFSQEGQAVAVSLLLVEEESGLSLPITLMVTSLNEGRR